MRAVIRPMSSISASSTTAWNSSRFVRELVVQAPREPAASASSTATDLSDNFSDTVYVPFVILSG